MSEVSVGKIIKTVRAAAELLKDRPVEQRLIRLRAAHAKLLKEDGSYDVVQLRQFLQLHEFKVKTIS